MKLINLVLVYLAHSIVLTINLHKYKYNLRALYLNWYLLFLTKSSQIQILTILTIKLSLYIYIYISKFHSIVCNYNNIIKWFNGYKLKVTLEKYKFIIISVGVEVQNLYVLGLGLTKVQIDKYWILILIREPELPRR